MSLGPDINENLELQRKEIAWGKYATYFLLAFLGLAFFGLFGSGPLSTGNIKSGGGQIEVNYPRFLRVAKEEEIRIKVNKETPETSIGISKTLLEDVNVENISPQPDAQTEREGKIFYLFRLVGDQKEAVFRIVPQESFNIKTEVTVIDGESVSFRQITYP